MEKQIYLGPAIGVFEYRLFEVSMINGGGRPSFGRLSRAKYLFREDTFDFTVDYSTLKESWGEHGSCSVNVGTIKGNDHDLGNAVRRIEDLLCKAIKESERQHALDIMALTEITRGQR